MCLPPNSTHLTQPLDVAIFGPVKRIWRAVLQDWRVANPKGAATLPKEVFPNLLRKTIERLTVITK